MPVAELPRRAPDVAAQRAREVGLVVVPELVDDIARRSAPAAASTAAARTRSICRTAPRLRPVAARKRRSSVRSETRRPVDPADAVRDQGVADDDAVPDETVDERFGVVGVRRLPAATVEPEASGGVTSGSTIPLSTSDGVATARSDVPTANWMPTKRRILAARARCRCGFRDR